MTTQIQKDILEALDSLRDAAYYKDTYREGKLLNILVNFLKPSGYTVVSDPTKLYVIKPQGNLDNRQAVYK